MSEIQERGEGRGKREERGTTRHTNRKKVNRMKIRREERRMKGGT